jgi:hypothetical protein
MGSFDGWSQGAAMTLAGDQWVASLELSTAREIAYKFLLDGQQWVADPRTRARATTASTTRC